MDSTGGLMDTSAKPTHRGITPPFCNVSEPVRLSTTWVLDQFAGGRRLGAPACNFVVEFFLLRSS
jgi:hypothetical protein